MNRILLLTYGRPRAPVAPSGDVTIQSDLRLRPTIEFPSNPYWIARLALGKEPTSERELEAAFGMPMKALLARSGPLFGPDIGELIKQIRSRVRPSGAVLLQPQVEFTREASAKSAKLAGKGSAQVIGGARWAPAQSDSLSADYFPAYDRFADEAEQAREQLEQRRERARENEEALTLLSMSGPTLLSRLGVTPAQWQAMPCQEQYQRLRNAVAPAVPSAMAVLTALDSIDRSIPSAGWADPSLFRWAALGAYADSPPHVLDARQGCVGNCYLIAALAGIAWVRPDIITAGNWRGGAARVPRSGSQTIVLNQPAASSAAYRVLPDGQRVGVPIGQYPISVTDRVPLYKNVYSWAGSLDDGCVPLYGHGAVPSQSWPAIWEKAMAKFVDQDPTDQPNMGASAYSIFMPNEVILAGGGSSNIFWSYLGRQVRSADDVWRYLTEHCDSSGKVTSILRAASLPTAGEGDVRGGAVDMGSNIVGSHAYSVLGIVPDRTRRLVALRNPWGNTAPLSVDGRGEWMGLRIGEGGVGLITLEALMANFNAISGNWYGTPRFGDIVPPNYR